MSGAAMSYRSNHQVFPFRQSLADALRRVGLPAKQIARDIHASERTVENWKSGKTDISGAAVAKLCADNDVFWREFCAAVGRPASADDAARFLDEFNEWRKARGNHGQE